MHASCELRMQLLILLCLISFSSGAEIIERLVVVPARNLSTGVANRLVCQKFSDIQPQQPCLHAADHFSLPLNISSAINTLYFSFLIRRVRHDADPDSITLQLMYDNTVKPNSPGSVFFSKTVRAPNNPPMWSNVSNEELINLNVSQGEWDGDVMFDLANTSFLPREKRLWLGLFVTGERHYRADPYAENIFYWCTTDQAARVGDKTPYYYKDEADFMTGGFTNWTNGTVVQIAFGLKAEEKHMAFSLTLLAVVPTTILEKLEQVQSKGVIIGCVILAFLVMCCCVLCICKRCKQWRISLGKRRGGDTTTPVYQVETLYEPISTTGTTSTTDSHIDLETKSGSASTIDKFPSIRSGSGRNPSSSFLESTTKIPVVVNGDLYDKDK